jgi:hypothetical protein
MCTHVLDASGEADFYNKMDSYIAQRGLEDFKQLVKKLKRKSLGLAEEGIAPEIAMYG